MNAKGNRSFAKYLLSAFGIVTLIWTLSLFFPATAQAAMWYVTDEVTLETPCKIITSDPYACSTPVVIPGSSQSGVIWGVDWTIQQFNATTGQPMGQPMIMYGSIAVGSTAPNSYCVGTEPCQRYPAFPSTNPIWQNYNYHVLGYTVETAAGANYQQYTYGKPAYFGTMTRTMGTMVSTPALNTSSYNETDEHLPAAPGCIIDVSTPDNCGVDVTLPGNGNGIAWLVKWYLHKPGSNSLEYVMVDWVTNTEDGGYCLTEETCLRRSTFPSTNTFWNGYTVAAYQVETSASSGNGNAVFYPEGDPQKERWTDECVYNYRCGALVRDFSFGTDTVIASYVLYDPITDRYTTWAETQAHSCGLLPCEDWIVFPVRADARIYNIRLGGSNMDSIIVEVDDWGP